MKHYSLEKIFGFKKLIYSCISGVSLLLFAGLSQAAKPWDEGEYCFDPGCIMAIVGHDGVKQICPPWSPHFEPSCLATSAMYKIRAPQISTPSGIKSSPDTLHGIFGDPRPDLTISFLTITDGRNAEKALKKIRGKRGPVVYLRVTDHAPGGYEGFPEEYVGYHIYKVQDWKMRKGKKGKITKKSDLFPSS